MMCQVVWNILSIGLENVDLENKVLVTVLLKILVLSEPSKKWITFETFCWSHNLKIHKLLDDESIAMILKEMQENAQFEDT